MKESLIKKVSRCTYCNSTQVTIGHHHDLGVVMCLCTICGNRWGQ
jgi:hypothetical protein